MMCPTQKVSVSLQIPNGYFNRKLQEIVTYKYNGQRCYGNKNKVTLRTRQTCIICVLDVEAWCS